MWVFFEVFKKIEKEGNARKQYMKLHAGMRTFGPSGGKQRE
jgi:prophage antirepressor-like protein